MEIDEQLVRSEVDEQWAGSVTCRGRWEWAKGGSFRRWRYRVSHCRAWIGQGEEKQTAGEQLRATRIEPCPGRWQLEWELVAGCVFQKHEGVAARASTTVASTSNE